MQVADLELIIADIASIKVLEVAELEKRPRRTFGKITHQVPRSLVDCCRISLAKYYLEDDLVLFCLDAVDDAQHMLALEPTLPD